MHVSAAAASPLLLCGFRGHAAGSRIYSQKVRITAKSMIAHALAVTVDINRIWEFYLIVDVTSRCNFSSVFPFAQIPRSREPSLWIDTFLIRCMYMCTYRRVWVFHEYHS